MRIAEGLVVEVVVVGVGLGVGGWRESILSDRLWRSNLLRRQVNQSGGSELDGAHIQQCT